MKQKIVFLDIDGTMVDAAGRIPASTKEALRRAQENGHRLVICSGRSRFQIYDELLDLGFSGIVGAAGAFVEADGKEIYHAYIDEAHGKKSFEYLEKNGFLYCYQADDGIVLNQRSFVEADGKEIYHAYIDEAHGKKSFEYLEKNGFLYCYQADDGIVLNQRSFDGIIGIYREVGMSESRLTRLMGNMHLTEEPWKNSHNEKGIVLNQRSFDGIIGIYREVGMSESRLTRLMGNMHLTEEPWKNSHNEKIIYYQAPFPLAKVHADLEPYFDAIAFSMEGIDAYAGEIGINGIHKATGMERYLNYVGMSREDSIAIGDGANDLQMMEYAGIGVAMGNALLDVKKRADMVTDAIGEDGLYRAFVKLGLI